MEIEKLKDMLQYIDMEKDPEDYEKIQKWIDQEYAVRDLPWEMVQKIRNLNGYSLYPLDWEKIQVNYQKKYERDLDFDQEEFEAKLKRLCDSLYDWGLYETCPDCGSGMKIPIWKSRRQWTAFCGCSNYPECNYAIDRGGERLYI